MNWQDALKKNIRDAGCLNEYVKDLDPEELKQLDRLIEKFPMSVPSYYLSLIDWRDENDPIRRMSIPSLIETDLSGESDTSGEHDNTVLRGMQHKYPQTVLILSTSQCVMYCRYCFRKRMVGADNQEIAADTAKIFDYIREHEEVTNVLVSGGDSFLNNNETIRTYLENLSSISHLDFIRFGTKIPVVFPQRIVEDQEFLNILRHYNAIKQIYVVTQFNHPRELTTASIQSVRCLLELGITVKNQTVLMKNINDDPQVLGELMRRLSAIGASPYYVFQCRPVAGVKNQFQVPLREGARVVEAARRLQNGQGKCFRYVLSNWKGKVEILGEDEDGSMLFKYHQAKDRESIGKLFRKRLGDGDCWIE